jgi:hypothetical protein
MFPSYFIQSQPSGPSLPVVEKKPNEEKKVETLNKFGCVAESAEIKAIRPFVLPSEINATGSKNKGKKSNKDNKYVVTKEKSMPFDNTGTMPRMKIYINPNDAISIEATYVAGSFINTSTTIPTFNAVSWTLSGTWRSDYASLASVFDQYKLDSLEVWITPAVTENLTTANNTFANLYSVIDYDESAAPSTLTELTDYQNCISSPIYQGHFHHFQPHIAVAYYGGAFTSFGNTCNQWVDCSSPGVQHYGVKVGATSTPNAAVNISLTMRAIVSFRNPR